MGSFINSETRRATSFLVSVFGFCDMSDEGLKCAIERARQVTDHPTENQGFQEVIALGFVALFLEPVNAMNPVYSLDPVDQPSKVFQVTDIEHKVAFENTIVRRNGD